MINLLCVSGGKTGWGVQCHLRLHAQQTVRLGLDPASDDRPTPPWSQLPEEPCGPDWALSLLTCRL